MEALGRLFNYIAAADNVYINVRDAGGVSFLCYLTGGAGDTWTLTEATTSGGGSAAVLATITQWYTCTGDGTDAWVKHTQAAASTVVTAAAAAENAACFHVKPEELSAGFDYIKVASTGAGLVTAVAHDLLVQRAPANLPALGA